jgi:hypothetical protein
MSAIDGIHAARPTHGLPTLDEVLLSVADAGPVRFAASVLVTLAERTPAGPERDALVRALAMLAPQMFHFEPVKSADRP